MFSLILQLMVHRGTPMDKTGCLERKLGSDLTWTVRASLIFRSIFKTKEFVVSLPFSPAFRVVVVGWVFSVVFGLGFFCLLLLDFCCCFGLVWVGFFPLLSKCLLYSSTFLGSRFCFFHLVPQGFSQSPVKPHRILISGRLCNIWEFCLFSYSQYFSSFCPSK